MAGPEGGFVLDWESAMAAQVSIVIPTHNRTGLLRRALQSLLDQTYSHWECIIVDDASTEDIGAAVAAIAPGESRMRVVRLEERRGATIARAIGCDHARGSYIALLDSDDWWHPLKLERQAPAMQPPCGGAGADPDQCPVLSLHAIEMVSAAAGGSAVVDHVHPRQNFLRDLVRDNFAAHGSFLMRRDAYQAIGGYDRRLPLSEDWDLLIRMILRFGEERIVPLPEVLSYWWVHDQNISADGAGVVRAQRSVVRRAVVNRGLLLRRPRLALEMIDRQLDRDMHTMAWRRPMLACAIAMLSALGRPYRLWRWQRAIQFARRAVSSRARQSTIGGGAAIVPTPAAESASSPAAPAADGCPVPAAARE
jgi:glycosyltransferase involved in cell wall biosynthesis